MIGDGEAETGPLAASWHSNKFLNPAHDGAVLPILHLNGYKIANPTILGRLDDDELASLLKGYGHEPLFVEGNDPAKCIANGPNARRGVRSNPRHPGSLLAAKASSERPTLADDRIAQSKGLDRPQGGRRQKGRRFLARPSGANRRVRTNPAHLEILEDWMRSYRPENLFDDKGASSPELQALAPGGARRMGANPHANGGTLKRKLELPDYAKHAVEWLPGAKTAEATRDHGRISARRDPDECGRARTFRLMGPDETSSNRL